MCYDLLRFSPCSGDLCEVRRRLKTVYLKYHSFSLSSLPFLHPHNTHTHNRHKTPHTLHHPTNTKHQTPLSDIYHVFQYSYVHISCTYSITRPHATVTHIPITNIHVLVYTQHIHTHGCTQPCLVQPRQENTKPLHAIHMARSGLSLLRCLVRVL